MEKEWDLIKHENIVHTELQENVKIFTKADSSNLIEMHAKIIANHFHKDEDRFVQAIKNKDLSEINKLFPGLSPNFANEIIFNFKNYDSEKLTLGATTGLMAKALQRGYKDLYQNPIIVQGLLITRDNRIVFGVRSKPSFRAEQPDEPFDFKIMLCPAGYAKFNKDGNLIRPFYSELAEELGLLKENITDLSLFCHHKDVGFSAGTRITYATYIDLLFDDVVGKWKKAPHGWEYVDLIGITCNEVTIKQMLITDDFSVYSKKTNGLFGPSVRPILGLMVQNLRD